MVSSHDENRPSRRSKSADAFRTISEVSDDVGVPQHVLRFWETKFAQIKPLKRGGGRRYYRPEDIDLLHRIRAWLYDDGYTIKGVQKLLKDGGAIAPATGRPASDDDREDDEADSGRSADQFREQDEDRGVERPVLKPHDVDQDDDVAPSYDRGPASAERTIALDDIDVGRVEATPVVQESAMDTERAARVAAEKADPTRVSVDDLNDDVPLQEGAPPDFGAWEKASLDGVIESLEEIRDRLRGPPPDP